jgi:hypothetical protein
MVNVLGTLNVLVAERDAGVRRVVYSGSSSAYGDQPRLPLLEDMEQNPMNPYGLQKLTGEQYTGFSIGCFQLRPSRCAISTCSVRDGHRGSVRHGDQRFPAVAAAGKAADDLR